jgi:hypothetical protein
LAVFFGVLRVAQIDEGDSRINLTAIRVLAAIATLTYLSTFAVFGVTTTTGLNIFFTTLT